jgi:hypothetical protein
MRTREAVPMCVLAGLVHVETMMSVFDDGYRKARRTQQRQHRDDQCGLATTGPANDPEDLQTVTFNQVGLAG